MHELSGARRQQLGRGIAAEMEVVRVHVASDFLIKDGYIDAAKWSPLIYNFHHHFDWRSTDWEKHFARKHKRPRVRTWNVGLDQFNGGLQPC